MGLIHWHFAKNKEGFPQILSFLNQECKGHRWQSLAANIYVNSADGGSVSRRLLLQPIVYLREMIIFSGNSMMDCLINDFRENLDPHFWSVYTASTSSSSSNLDISSLFNSTASSSASIGATGSSSYPLSGSKLIPSSRSFKSIEE